MKQASGMSRRVVRLDMNFATLADLASKARLA